MSSINIKHLPSKLSNIWEWTATDVAISHRQHINNPQFTKKFCTIHYHFQYSNKEYIIIQNKEFLFKSTFYICKAWPSVKLPGQNLCKCPCEEDTFCCVSERTISFLLYAVKCPEKCNECVWKSVYHETCFLFTWKTLKLNNADFLRVPHFQRNQIYLSFILQISYQQTATRGNF